MPESPTPTTYEKGKLYEIALSELLADPQQPRKSMDAEALAELTASVAKMGVVQPIIFRLDEQGNKVVVAGERRATAARQAGLATIPASSSLATTRKPPWSKISCAKTSPPLKRPKDCKP